MTRESPPLPRLRFKPASSAIVEKDGRYLLVRRANPPSADMYAFPGGRGEPGETAAETAIRELAEETGIRATEPVLFATYELAAPAGPNGPVGGFFLSVFTVRADETSFAAAAAADDAAEMGWFTIEEALRLNAPESVYECLRRLDAETGR
ncbi:ADP-ribose pyrophosphatase YjhB, NUDIX family [Rhizobium sp. RU20A]|uniref:NUDIX hydrolase n=1 Tax=Rhizobium sp. RU20A TaxID=1907412 RepID=UPI000956EB2C|nr:NUDIX domain-containing protein [Rhizobium sp. RU20A]SIP92511.1 ADP-ribose pyrophosphatase YjhB, NUDIX family [Rhizobium sp. RU20A]